MIVLPLLRPLRLLRLIPLLSVLNRRAQTGLRGRVAIYVAGGASLLAFVAAIAVLDVERSSPDANITDFGDAIWWAVTTMTTVGYGDRYPVTSIGRLVAFALMVGGIALLGTVTATLASWLVERVRPRRSRRRTCRHYLLGSMGPLCSVSSRRFTLFRPSTRLMKARGTRLMEARGVGAIG